MFRLQIWLSPNFVAWCSSSLGGAQCQAASNTSILVDIQSSLGPKLSSGADILLPRGAGYDFLARRYTDFERPAFSAIIAVASNDNVVEVVCCALAIP